LVVAFAFAAALAVGATFAAPTRAFAASDQIDSFNVTYTVSADGVLHVQETIVWRFGDSSGRHGIDLFLVTREPYDSTQDAVYGVTNITVASPSGAATTFSTQTTTTQKGREATERIRIGDPDKTISAPTATYVISYDVSGAIRTFSGYDEFFWDATGFGNPAISKFTATVSVPGGVQDVSCFAGPPKSTATCSTAPTFTKGGTATYQQTNIPAEQGVSIGAKILSGQVTDNRPHLVPDGSRMTSSQKVAVGAAAAVGLGLTVGSPIVGVVWWRRHGRDQRYAGLAPGTVPLPGQTAQVVPNDPDLPIPVAFSPPKIPVAEAGLLIDGQVDARETAATIIDLAVRGALTVRSTGDDDFAVTLVDPNRAAAPHEMVLLTNLFSGAPPGAVADLSTQGSLQPAHRAMVEAVRTQVAARGWFRKVPSARAVQGSRVGVVAVAALAFFGFGAKALWVLLPLLPVIITVAIIHGKLRRGQRTADGRAVCDQVEGFKTYLATAEANQLRFEEGEDIFSRYLPWAIAFELADRWAKICADLVAMGRLPDQTPGWYYGNNYSLAAFNIGFLTSSLTSAAAPAPSAGSSGTGFGGGSSFGGGGFSGGGGGGGGSGSW
jgi:uncharacterized membrane protein YgcG